MCLLSIDFFVGELHMHLLYLLGLLIDVAWLRGECRRCQDTKLKSRRVSQIAVPYLPSRLTTVHSC